MGDERQQQLPPHGSPEREQIEEIRAWLFERGYKMAVTYHEHGGWSAPLMREDVVTGVAPYGTGETPLEAAQAARQLFLDTPRMHFKPQPDD